MAEIKETTKVMIENNVSWEISFFGESGKRIHLPKRGSKKNVTVADLVILDSDATSMLNEGVIYIEDKDVREHFGLDYDGIIHYSEIGKILDTKSANEIKEVVKKAPDAIKEEVANVAKEKKIDSKKKTKAVEEATGKKVDEE